LHSKLKEKYQINTKNKKMIKFNLANKYDFDKINDTLDKFKNIQNENNIVTSFDGKIISTVQVSNKYYNFDFAAFCKNIVLEIENYFTPEAYMLRIRQGTQELRLVGEEIDVNGEPYLKMLGITNSTNTQLALSMNVGLVRKSNVTGSVHLSFRNKHYKATMPDKLKNFADNLINFNMDIEYHVKTLNDLATKEMSFLDLAEALSTNIDGDKIKSMNLKVRALGKKLSEYGYSKFRNTLNNPFSDTVEDFKINTKDIFDAYTELFKKYDTSVIARETRRILTALNVD
jgi:hypothetical protein